MRCRFRAVLVFLALVACGVPASGTPATDGAADWLLSRQAADGGIYALGDVAAPFQSTYEARAVLEFAQRTEGIDAAAARDFLAATGYDSTEYLAARLLSGVAATNDGQPIKSLLLARRNGNGGFGDKPGFQSTAYDTYWALLALEVTGNLTEGVRAAGATFLLNAQADDGSWQYSQRGSVYLTARVVQLLALYRTRYLEVPAALAGAQTFLAAHAAAESAPPAKFFSGCAALSALSTSMATTSLDPLATLVASAQSADGSWRGDVLTTSLCLRAQLQYEAWRNSQPVGSGAVTGRVVHSGSSEPVPNVEISAQGTAGGALTTVANGAGEFSISGVPAGPVDLTFSKPGYQPVVRFLDLSGGGVDLGAIPMAPGGDTASVAGVVLDARTGSPVPGVNILLGATVALSDQAGRYFAQGFSAGTLNYSATAAGYHVATGSMDVVAGSIVRQQLWLVPEGTVLDDAPAELTGTVVDGATGAPIVANVTVAGIGSFGTDHLGRFTVPGVPRGDHTLVISAAGWSSATYRLTLPPGAAGDLGRLPLYPSTDLVAADRLLLRVRVLDAVSGSPVPGAEVDLDLGRSGVTDDRGVVDFSGIELLEFGATASATNYLSAQLRVSVDGYGETALDILLTPNSGELTDQSVLAGRVTDGQGNPLAGVALAVAGAETAVTDVDGRYRLEGITQLAFELRATKDGYEVKAIPISVARFGNYQLDLTMKAVGPTNWYVPFVEVPQQVPHANQDIIVRATVQNLTAQAEDVVVRGEVVDSAGQWVADLITWMPGTMEPAGAIPFSESESRTVELFWNTAQHPPGNYRVLIRVVQNGSTSPALPTGVVYASGAKDFSLAATRGITGELDFSPPLSQAGAQTPVRLGALVRNAGNVPLPAGDFRLVLTDEDGAVLLTRQTVAAEIPIGNLTALDFGEWTPTAAGHFYVAVDREDLPEAGAISAIYYVGDVATASFTIDREVLPAGDSSIGAQIDVQGVDTTQGSATDPLYEQVRASVSRGGAYVGSGAISWNNRERCLGCHIQTQSLVGLASSIGRAPVDETQARILYNVISGSQRGSGSLHVSHNQYVKTQTEFGVWALGAWPDKRNSHRAKLKALQFLWDRRSVSGNTTFWTDEHNSGWFRVQHESTTAAVSTAIADLIRADAEIGDQEIADFARTAQMNLGGSATKPYGIAVRDGNVFIAKQGAIEIFSPLTETTTRYFSDAAGRAFFDVAFDETGILYAITDNKIVRINPDNSTSELTIGPGLRDIEYWNGDFYVSEWDNHRIWRVSPNLQAVVFAAGGLLNRPQGLAVSADDKLIVANYSGFNLLKISTEGEVSVFVDGLAYPPRMVANGSSAGEYVIASGRYASNDSVKPPGIQRIRSDGTVEALFESENSADLSVLGLAMVGDRLYFTDYPGNQIEKLETFALNRSLVQTLRSGAVNIANYFLNEYTSNDNEILNVAFRLVGLGELRTVIDDAATLNTIDQAIPHIAGLLRQRQRADGGWGRYATSASDPLTTAWVGYALDYTSPSADDPMVRNAITYLLNRQRADGSWTGQYFDTRLGATSMVMAYMPRALERLGGLDVHLSLDMPLDVAVTSTDIAPTEVVALADGRQGYRWNLQGVTGRGRAVNLELAIADLRLHETRAVADLAQLGFANSFTGETMVRDIAIPSVTAVSGLALDTGTDKPEYLANETVAILSDLVNGGEAFDGGKLVVTIRTSAGDVVEVLAEQPAVAIAGGETSSYTNHWNTGTYPAGAYVVQAEVQDGAVIQVEAVAQFTILPSDGQQPIGISYDADIHTDKSAYLPYESVDIFSRVSNLTINSQQAPVLARIRVRSEAGEVLFSRNIVVPELGGKELRDYQDLLALGDVAPGIYTASIELWNADISTLLAQDSTVFAVLDQPLAHLLGNVTASSASVYRGQPVGCRFTTENRSSSAAIAPGLEYQLVDVANQEVKESEAATQTLAAGQQHLANRQYDTASLVPGGYACVLKASLDGQSLTLGFAGFTVLPPPLTVTVAEGGKGRLLVLLDDPASSGPGEISGLQQQYDYLRALLDAEGYSYTIVFDAADFAREFHSGEYHAYALMSEQVTLAGEVEQQLAEAVFSGDGLLISGAFNRRNGHLERALGIVVTGRETQADGVLLPDGALGEDWSATAVNPAVKLDFERCGARLLGIYLNPVKGTQTEDPACYLGPDGDAAAAGHDYGLGYSVFVGFDTLDEATAIGGDNTYRAILRHVLEIIQPDEFKHFPGSVVPVELAVQADAVVLDARLTLTLSDNLELVAQVPTLEALDGAGRQWQWQGHLLAGDSRSLTQYVKLRDANPAAVDTFLEASFGAGWFEIGHSTYPLDAEPLGDPLAQATTLLTALGDYSKVVTAVDKARTFIAAGDTTGAINSLLTATGGLLDATEADAIEARLLLDRMLFALLAGE